jgi:hypothetical protein
MTAAMATMLSGYGNIPIVGPNNSPIYIAKDNVDNDYIISVALEKGNGNVMGTGSATFGIVPGPIVSTYTGYAVRTP